VAEVLAELLPLLLDTLKAFSVCPSAAQQGSLLLLPIDFAGRRKGWDRNATPLSRIFSRSCRSGTGVCLQYMAEILRFLAVNYEPSQRPKLELGDAMDAQFFENPSKLHGSNADCFAARGLADTASKVSARTQERCCWTKPRRRLLATNKQENLRRLRATSSCAEMMGRPT
jgi:hypothetical protein